MPKTRDTSGRIRIQITEQDIAKATQNNSMRCVVAQAIARTIPTASRIDVDLQTIRWSQDGVRNVWLTPYTVSGYVIAFDAGDTIEPFTFMLDPRRRVPVKQQRKTKAGSDISTAAGRKRRLARKVTQLELAAKGETDPPPTKGQRAVAVEQLPAVREEAAKAAQLEAETRAAHEGQKQTERVNLQPEGVNPNIGDKVHTDPPRRTIRTSERHYGMRVLRVNQK